jgi:hypothetical protein
MRLSLKAKLRIPFFWFFLAASCATPPAPKLLSPVEQIAVDTERARNLSEDFKKSVRFVQGPRLERFLTRMAVRIAGSSRDFPLDRIEVKIHLDSNPSLGHAFSFPGTFISIPLGFLKQEDFENEVAALISYELSNVINRHLANRVESGSVGERVRPVLFGDASVFDFDREERSKSIRLGTNLLYFSGYDVRGMTSMFQRLPGFFINPGTDPEKKEVEFNLREAQRARSGLLPSIKPIVRSSEFIQFKRELARIR